MCEAIIALPESNRQQIEADFRDIDALASERGFRAVSTKQPGMYATVPNNMDSTTISRSASPILMASTNGPCGFFSTAKSIGMELCASLRPISLHRLTGRNAKIFLRSTPALIPLPSMTSLGRWAPTFTSCAAAASTATLSRFGAMSSTTSFALARTMLKPRRSGWTTSSIGGHAIQPMRSSSSTRRTREARYLLQRREARGARSRGDLRGRHPRS